MKRYFGPLFAAMTIVLAASCSEQIGNELVSESANLVKMTFSASMGEEVDSKTTYSGRKVYWEESDAITVFSVAENGVAKNVFSEPELLENRAVARFSGLADASADAYYAVYPHAESNNFSEDGISVKFPTTHTAFVNGFPSGSNIAVAVSVKDSEQNLQFKNVGALLSFSFKDLETALNTQSVTFKAKKNDTEYWGLSGATTFTLDENGLPIAAEGDSQEVVVNAPEGGFNTGVAYFIPVIPVGECTGMEVVYTDLNGDTYTKRNDTDFELLRSYMFNIGQLRNPYPEVVKATKVDGIYDKDPNKFDDAVKYENIDYLEAIEKRLAVMDSTAFSLCMDNKIPIIVFNMNERGNIQKAVAGEPIGTLVK